MILNNSLFLKTSIAALLVIFGVIIKNSFEQMNIPNHYIGKPLGIFLFLIGWILSAYSLSLYKQNKIVFIVPCVLIFIVVMMMKSFMMSGQSVPIYLPIIFGLSWILIGFMVGNHLKNNLKYVGLLSSICVLFSMMYLLPIQRNSCIVDEPGMPLFVIVWAIIIILNSLR